MADSFEKIFVKSKYLAKILLSTFLISNKVIKNFLAK